MTRHVDALGDLDVHVAIAAAVTGRAHLTCVPTRDALGVRHAAFGGGACVTEKLALVGPNELDHVLHADCMAYTEERAFPIDGVSAAPTSIGQPWLDLEPGRAEAACRPTLGEGGPGLP